MFYTIYKTTNKINGKIYIGKHQTKNLDDGYKGSGKHLWGAIKKYGIENFEKEILFIFDNETEMNIKEAEIVNEDFVKENTNYNLCPGGKGGWGYVNSSGLRTKGHTKEMYKRQSETLKSKPKSYFNNPNKINAIKKAHREGKIKYDTFTGKQHTKETKIKIGLKTSQNIGDKNSQYGTIWITNGKDNKKIKYDSVIPENWHNGRTYVPIFNDISICAECRQRYDDLYWLDAYQKSNVSIVRFVNEIYPYNRASFYKMKSRLGF